jgi:hypothetical protein
MKYDPPFFCPQDVAFCESDIIGTGMENVAETDRLTSKK